MSSQRLSGWVGRLTIRTTPLFLLTKLSKSWENTRLLWRHSKHTRPSVGAGRGVGSSRSGPVHGPSGLFLWSGPAAASGETPLSRYHAAFIPAALLVLALASLPYGYYTFLRFVVTGWALFIAWGEYQRAGTVNGWSVGFVLVAALFNPLVPVHLDRGTWAYLDLGSAALFCAYVGLRLLGKVRPS
jgi:hypothetical protein